VEAAATARGIEVMALDRFSLTGKVASGLLLGFGPFAMNSVSKPDRTSLMATWF